MKLGFECLKYGICLGTRTMFDGVYQLLGASQLTVRKKDLLYKVESYWNYRISAQTSFNSIEEAAASLDKFSIKRSLKN